MTGRQPGATQPRRRRRVGVVCVLGLALLAGVVAVGAAGPDLPNEAARAAPARDVQVAEEPEFAFWPPTRTTLWCGHELHYFYDSWTFFKSELFTRRSGTALIEQRGLVREDGGMAPLRNLGDFDGDGKDDVLLRHADGRWHYYQMNGRRVHTSGPADLTQELAWEVAGIGDFNGDRKDDVLLRHTNPEYLVRAGDEYYGGWYYYAMDGRRILADSGPVPLPRYFGSQVAIGDFDGDGRDDVLLRDPEQDDDGNYYDRWHYYRMDGRRVVSGHTRHASGRVRLTRDPTWRIAGIADLNRDGKDDVLLRKTDGRWYFYPMDGQFVLPGRGTVRMTRDLAWQMVGIGRFDVDVRKSVLLRHQDGRWRYYRVQGRQVVGGPFAVDITDDTSETVAGIGDLNGDGQTDVLARRADGSWYYYAMYDGRVASFGTGLPGTPALSEDLAWGALSCYNLATGTTLPGRTFIDHRDETVSLSFLSRAFDSAPVIVGEERLTYQARSSDADVMRTSVTGDVLTLMPVTQGTATVTVTARDRDGDLATQAFAVRVAGDRFRDCAECPEMVVVPAGEFTMGAPESEAEGPDFEDEGPQRTVSIPAFAASAHEVTFAQWDACAAAGGCPPTNSCALPDFDDGPWLVGIPDHRLVRVDVDTLLSRPGGDFAYYPDDHGWGRRDRPVIEVSWCNAQSYVQWLSRRFGQPYRLLTEAEWEYAARAGTTTPFHTGETIAPWRANFDGRYSYATGEWSDARGLYRGETVPVGSFLPNRFGFYDMHGNVAEYVQDCYGSYSLAPNNGSAAKRPAGCWGVARSGAWNFHDWYVRSASRLQVDFSERYDNVGFRVARTLEP